RSSFGFVSCRSRSAVRIDVLDLISIELSIAQRVADAASRTSAIFRRRSHVECIGTHAKAYQLGVDGRTAGLGMLQLFKNQRTSAVRQHETVTPLIPRPTCRRRIVVARGQSTSRGKTTNTQPAGGHFRATGNHYIRLAIGNVT